MNDFDSLLEELKDEQVSHTKRPLSSASPEKAGQEKTGDAGDSWGHAHAGHAHAHGGLSNQAHAWGSDSGHSLHPPGKKAVAPVATKRNAIDDLLDEFQTTPTKATNGASNFTY